MKYTSFNGFFPLVIFPVEIVLIIILHELSQNKCFVLFFIEIQSQFLEKKKPWKFKNQLSLVSKISLWIWNWYCSAFEYLHAVCFALFGIIENAKQKIQYLIWTGISISIEYRYIDFKGFWKRWLFLKLRYQTHILF